MATAFNFIGAFAGTAVANTIGSGLVDDSTSTTTVVAAALIGAITWNLITWRQGLPSSSSHALIGGLLGATLIASGPSALNPQGIVDKVLVPMVTSPLLGYFIALALVVAAVLDIQRLRTAPHDQSISSFAGSVGRFHGVLSRPNDAQKTMGIITLALFSAGLLPTVTVPPWVIVVSATAISMGTAAGGWRIMRHDGHQSSSSNRSHGFAAETTAATIIYGAAHSACRYRPLT